MWVRSQNKECLVNTSVFQLDEQIYEYREGYFIEAITNNDLYELGEYATKERALEVLDDIQGAIAACEVAKTTDTIKAVVNTLNEKQFASVALGLFIYQMPEK